MRVLFLLTQSLDGAYGIGRCGPLARHMARLGYQVEIAALHPAWSSLCKKQFVQDGVVVSYPAQMHVYTDGQRRLYFSTPRLLLVALRAIVALAQVALSRRVDAIHLGKAQPMNGLAGWLGARLHRTRLFVDCDDYEAESNRFSAAWQRFVVRWWEDNLPRWSQGVTVNTTFMRQRCVQLGVAARRVHLVPNGFDPERFVPVPEATKQSLRKHYGLDGKRIVLYVGTLSFVSHPVPLLLDAFAQVHRQIPDAVLLLVGGGEDYDGTIRAVQEKKLEDAVVMTGQINPMRIPSYYAISHVLVDPVYDNDVARARHPLKIVESLAMGTPVVTGDVGDRRITLGNGLGGILVKPGDAEALAEGIVMLLKDSARREWMCQQAQVISQQFRWDCLVHEFVKVYNI